MNDGDYVLGTRDDEVERLGLQHRVWRGRVLEAFRRARIRSGQRVVDVGAGPGFVTADLASLVGPSGRVIALERSPHFVDKLRSRGLANVEVREHDVSQQFGLGGADASWCRWLLSFVPTPAATVRHIGDALRPGGIAVFHEYAAYETWRIMPPNPLQERFRSLVMQSWSESGGEPDVALWLPQWLAEAGLEIVETRILADIITPADETWQWPRAFMETGARRLHELGYIEATEVEAMAVLLDEPPEGAHMLTPLVAEIIARKR
ncbi:methyltransferase domain-containing protein [Sphingomonas sp. URHD0057]|uniref:methyltransferase domain-containing protein n=1 Tax=Sphingomonas sp. URHD0057 TaxID=1380389 RepID=UPI000687DC9F|nr:methyltransferase domain-containing protein [Sphingomonas sp. URHD0057]